MHGRRWARKLAYWTLPPGVEILIRRTYGSTRVEPVPAIAEADRRLLARNESLRDRHKGQRCFILATGPSIKNQDLSVLKGETCISVSNFFVHPSFESISPRYHCIAPYHPPITEEAWQQWMRALSSKTEKTDLFFGISDKLRNEGIFDERNIYFLQFGGQWKDIENSKLDLAHSLPGPQSVSIMAIYIAIYMGFKDIYLLGCDHDWILHINKSEHFYPENQHELVKSGYSEWFAEDFESYCRDYINLWQQYKKVKEIARACSVAIFNATLGGLLDVFPRVDFQKINLPIK